MLSFPDEQFANTVAEALEHLWDYSYLGNQPLAHLQVVERRLTSIARSTHLDRGRVLSEVLQAAIDQLKPNKYQKQRSTEARFFPILYQAYVENLENETIAFDMNISVRTLYRERLKAIDVIARILWEWEKASAEVTR